MPLKVKTVRSGGVIKKVVKTTTAPANQPLQQSSETECLSLELVSNSADKNNNPSSIINDDTVVPKEVNDAKNIDDENNKGLNIKVQKKNSIAEENVLLVGDIVWSKIPGHCWWPSMISYDPVDAVFFTKLNGKFGSTKFHVQFFGDKSLRGWVYKSSIIKFEGKDHFLKLPGKIIQKSKLPSSSQRSSWENAVKQADKALILERNERLLKYVFSYEDENSITKKKEPVIINKKIEKKQQAAHKSEPKKEESNPAVEVSTEKAILQEVSCIQVTVNCPLPPQEQQLESNSDSGIEDIGENPSDYHAENLIDPNNSKRKRKQKVFTDYHTGEEFTLAIKSTTWKPLPPSPEKRRKSNRMKKSPDNVNHPKAATAMIEKDAVIGTDENVKENGIDLHPKKKRKYTVIKLPNTEPLLKDVEKSKSQKIPPLVMDSSIFGSNCHIKLNKKSKIESQTEIKTKKSKTNKVKEQYSKSCVEQPKVDSETIADDLDEKNIKVRHDQYCSLCEEANRELVTCAGHCLRSFHCDCLGLSCKPKGSFKCDECQMDRHSCFHCKKPGNVIKCSQVSCGKFYHSECMELLQPDGTEDKKSTSGRFFCPQHSCKLCIFSAKSKNTPKNTSLQPNNSKKLIKCIRCPTAYHQKSCLIAGSILLTPNAMICEQHFEVNKSKKNHTHINVTWCFVCSVGGSLVCCDTCPASFHPECTDELTGIPEGSWKCQDCRQHKKPKYGDIVWVKFGVYRWWPAKICFPEDVPDRILALCHSHGEFPVMFFGSRDYAWLHSGRVFRYEEGDKGGKLSKRNSLGNYFTKALEEAKQAYAELKMEEAQLSESMDRRKAKKPPPYKHIKMNRPVSCIRTILDPSEWPVCECSEESPCTGESECLNQMLYFECSGKTCKAGEKCQNQKMQKCQYKKLKPFKCEGRGWGLKSDQEIKSGDFVIEYVGELIDEETCQKRVKYYHEEGISDYYFLTIDRDNIIDAYPKGNLSRFMNHSCDPNCETQKWTVNGEVRVGLFATRDINAGEELCFNYHLDCMGNEKKQCKCGSANCSGYLGVKPKTQHSMTVAEKAQNKKKKEKERRKLKIQKKKMQKIVHDDECFICTDGGDLILCSRGKCTKAYHLDCLNLEKIPHGKWQCPWHFCDNCGKLAKSMCALCPNSYCKVHEEGEIFPLRENVVVCSDHTEKEFDTFLSELKKKDQMEVVNSPTSPSPPVQTLSSSDDVDNSALSSDTAVEKPPGDKEDNMKNPTVKDDSANAVKPDVMIESGLNVPADEKKTKQKKGKTKETSKSNESSNPIENSVVDNGTSKSKYNKSSKGKGKKNEANTDSTGDEKAALKDTSTKKKSTKSRKTPKEREPTKTNASVKALKPKKNQLSKGKVRKEKIEKATKNKKLVADVAKNKNQQKDL